MSKGVDKLLAINGSAEFWGTESLLKNRLVEIANIEVFWNMQEQARTPSQKLGSMVLDLEALSELLNYVLDDAYDALLQGNESSIKASMNRISLTGLLYGTQND